MEDYTVQVKNVSKNFRIYHERYDSVYEKVTGWFNKKEHYEDLQVLKDVSFSVRKGEMVGIVGGIFEIVVEGPVGDQIRGGDRDDGICNTRCARAAGVTAAAPTIAASIA